MQEAGYTLKVRGAPEDSPPHTGSLGLTEGHLFRSLPPPESPRDPEWARLGSAWLPASMQRPVHMVTACPLGRGFVPLSCVHLGTGGPGDQAGQWLAGPWPYDQSAPRCPWKSRVWKPLWGNAISSLVPSGPLSSGLPWPRGRGGEGSRQLLRVGGTNLGEPGWQKLHFQCGLLVGSFRPFCP